MDYIHILGNNTTVHYNGKDLEEIVDALNAMLQPLYEWCQQNQLAVHTGMSGAMHITSSPLVGPMLEVKFSEISLNVKKNRSAWEKSSIIDQAGYLR